MAALQRHVDSGVLNSEAVPCGTGGVAEGGGEFGSTVSMADRQRLEGEYSNACGLFTERSDSGDRLKTLSLVSLGVGAFATVGTIVWYFSDSGGSDSAAEGGPEQRNTATIIPLLSPDTQGVLLNFSF
jgi:hypothetical protein